MSDNLRKASGGTTAPSLKTVIMTPSTRTQGVRVDVDVVNLNDIPGAMDHMGRRWFATKPAWEMPETWRPGFNIDYLKLPPSQVEDQIIKMDWVLGFERVLPVIEDLQKNWNSQKGIKVLKDRLTTAGWQSGKTTVIGHTLQTGNELDLSCQVNVRDLGRYTDPMDDMYGAIFKATLKLAVVGKAYRSFLLKKDIFEIEKVGLYVRDTYDFNASWFEDTFIGLGIWSRKRILSKIETASYSLMELQERGIIFPGFVPTRNSDFRRWQKHRNEGGDFFVFSDVLWRPPAIKYVDL
jgi:hypothetical protein